MTLAVAVGLLVTLGFVMGFRFSIDSREISQISLVQFRSFPSGANVDINEVKQSFTTPGRQNIKSGETTIRMYRDGYRDWNTTVALRPGEIRWLNYARLIPKDITTDSVRTFPVMAEMQSSPDQHWILMRTDNTTRDLVLADISDPKNVRFSHLSIPADKITAPADGQTESLAIVEWDAGSRHILLRHTVDETVEFLKIDRKSPGTAQNLTRDFNMTMSDPHFSGNSGNVFFALTGSDLRKFDYGSNSVSAPLVTDVTMYDLYGDNKLTYAATTNKDPQQQIVGVYIDGKNTVIKTYNDSTPTVARFAHYYNSDYLAISRGETVTIIASPLSNGNSSSAVYLSSPGGIDHMMFSASGRFVIATHGTNIVSYDLETGDNYTFATSSFSGQPKWVDDYHLVDPSNSEIALIEFDGNNRNQIVSGRGDATLSSNGEYLFTLGDTNASVVLQRSKLITDD